MKIIVPSLGRAGKANSLVWLPEAKREIILAVHEDEENAYKKSYPQHQILLLPEYCRKHTGRVRQEILRKIREPFFFVDDDIRIGLKCVQSISAVFDTLERHMESGVSMAGIAPQFFSNVAKTSLINGDVVAVRNKFAATVYAINPMIFDHCPLNRLPVYEDIALVIHAIEHGGGTIVSYVATHANVSPKAGGCNSWRDEAVTLQSLLTLCQLYPHICSVRETKNTTHSQQIGLGLRVAWSKIRKV